MDERSQESKRVEDWLTRGRLVSFRTRGAVRTRDAPTPMPRVEVKGVEEVPKLLQQLNEEVPEVPWVVVVDGRIDSFTTEVCLKAKEARKTSKFWLVSSEKAEISESSPLIRLELLQLNPEDPDDQKFLKNLVADLVIISTEPKASQGERSKRWLSQARYVLTEKLD